jgi:hypothetical protein
MTAIRLGFAVMVFAATAAAPHALGRVADGTDCGGFTAADAAAWLKAPAGQVAREVSKAGDKWHCSFAVGKSPPAIAFSVAVVSSAKRATEDLERYRDDLAATGASPAWKNKLPQGVYSDMFGAGDEAVWTDINGTYTVRRDNVTVQVSLPKDKQQQVQLGKAVVGKF